MSENKLPVAINQGFVTIGNMEELECAVLDNGTRVLTQSNIYKALGRSVRSKIKVGNRVEQMPSFLDANNLQPFVSEELRSMINLIEYQKPTGTKQRGYNALILPLVCDTYLAARQAGALTKKQEPVAMQAEILVRSLSKVAIIALIDEATGYNESKRRAKDELQQFLAKFLRDEATKWVETFQEEYFEMIIRMRGWTWPLPTKRPGVVGKYINDIVYSRLAPNILEELRARNPKNRSGNRSKKHHQYLSGDLGHPKLKEHLAGVMALGRACGYEWNTFMRLLDKSYPKFGHTIELEFPERIEDLEPQKDLSDFNKNLKRAINFNPKDK